jgi:hypothetical protein
MRAIDRRRGSSGLDAPRPGWLGFARRRPASGLPQLRVELGVAAWKIPTSGLAGTLAQIDCTSENFVLLRKTCRNVPCRARRGGTAAS